MGKKNGMRTCVSGRGFTLIELLVVISIIALLLSVLLPSLGKAKESARRVVCGSNCKSIYTAMFMYVDDYKSTFFASMNGERWYDLGIGSSNTGSLLNQWDPLAYWGIAYVPYGAAMEVFKCPSKRWDCEQWFAVRPGDERAFNYSDYGLNGYTCWEVPESDNAYEMVHSPGEGRRKITAFRRLADVIVLHDAPESTLDDNGDMYHINPGYDKDGENLKQWRDFERTNPGRYGNSVKEFWRHSGSSNILWLDGHISNLKKTTGKDIPRVWYSGGLNGRR